MRKEEKLRMYSNPKTWKRGSFLTALTARGPRLGFALLLLFALVLTAASPTQAGTDMCSYYPVVNGYHVINGNDPTLTPLTLPSSIGIDANCLFENFPISAKWPDGLTSTVNFKFDGYLAIFNNVYYSGNMACATTTTKIWFVNNAQYVPNNSCQSLFIPVEKIDKQSPAPSAAIGVPFTYKLTIPVMYDPATGTVISTSGSASDLHSITVTDDLNATGVDLTYLGYVAYWQGSGTSVPLTFSNAGGVLTVSNLPIIPAGQQIVIEITAVLNDTSTNTAGKVFTNTAAWSFGRLIDGVFYEPLPGQNGISQPMVIAESNLVVTKTSSMSNLNVGTPAPYTINVQNSGGSDAWSLR